MLASANDALNPPRPAEQGRKADGAIPASVKSLKDEQQDESRDVVYCESPIEDVVGSASLGQSKVVGGHHYEKIRVASGAQAHIGDLHQHFHPRRQDSSELPQFWGVRSPSARFTGRSDHLESLYRWFLHEDTRKAEHKDRHKTAVIYGIGGSGKTQLARKFAQSVKDQFWGIFWIDASAKQNAANGYGALSNRFGQGNSCDAGINWLYQRRKKWLLILDNADEEDREIFDIDDMIPAGNQGHVLVTTRHKTLKDDIANVGSIHLEDMLPDEATALLLRCALNDEADRNKEENRQTAHTIATEMLHGLARSINAAGRFIREKEWTLKQYLDRLLPVQKAHEKDIERSLKAKKPTLHIDKAEVGRQASVETTWESPMAHIRAKASRVPAFQDAVHLFYIFTFIHYEGVPLQLFEDVWNSRIPVPANDKNTPDLLRTNQSDVEAMRDRLKAAVRVLYDYAIVESINFTDPTKSCYTFHPGVQASARKKMKDILPSPTMRPIWLRRTMHLLAASIPVDAEKLEPSVARMLIPHIIQCVDAVQKLDSERLAEDPDFRTGMKDFDESQQHRQEEVDDLVKPNHELERWKAQKSMLFNEEGTQLYERLVNVFDIVAWWTEAGILYRKALAYRRHAQGGRSVMTMQTERRLTEIQFLNHELEDCIRTRLFLAFKWWSARPSWSSWVRSPLRPDHIAFCNALNDLAAGLWQAQKHSPAIMTGEYAVRGYTKRLGPYHPKTLSARFTVGRTLFHMNKQEEAHAILQDVVILQKYYLKPKTPAVLPEPTDPVQTEFGALRSRPARRSIPILSRSTHGQKRGKRPWNVGYTELDTQWTRSDLAMNLRARLYEEDRREEKWWKSIIERIMWNVYNERLESWGEDHAYTLHARNEYAKALCIIGKADDALIIMKEAAPNINRILRTHGSARQMALGNLARAYAYGEKWPEAADTMADFYKDVQLSTPTFFMVRAAYARLELRAGLSTGSQVRLRAAEQELKILVARKETRIRKGIRDAATNNVLEQLAVLYKHTGQDDQLEKFKERFADVDENKPLGSMYDTFNTQFSEESGTLRTLYDLLLFMFVEEPKNALGALIVRLLKRLGRLKYGSDEEEDAAFFAKLEEYGISDDTLRS